MWLTLKMFLKPVWVGKIHGVGVYAIHSVRIWWFRNKFSLFQLKRMSEVTKKVAPGKKNHKNAKKYCQIVLFSSKKALVVCYSALQSGPSIFSANQNQNKISHAFCKLILAKVSTPCILPSHTGFKNIFNHYCIASVNKLY